MNLIILFDTDKIDGKRFRLSDHRAEHIRNILKSGINDSLEVGLLNGPIGQAVVEKIDVSEVILAIDQLSTPSPKTPEIDLICALPRPQTLKKVLLTSATMGVRRLHLIRANRVEKSYFHSPLLDEENYTRFLIEGLSQGKNTRLPEVTIHERFLPFIDSLTQTYPNFDDPDMLKLLPDFETNNSIIDLYNQMKRELLVTIGPEGGWVDFEIDQFMELGFKRFTLGGWTLRVESAVTAVLAQIELAKMSLNN